MCIIIVIALQNFLRNKKLVWIIYVPIIIPNKIDNIKINIYIYLQSRILEAHVWATTCEKYAWQCHAHLCDLLSSPIWNNPHACVRHAPHYADTLFSGYIRVCRNDCTISNKLAEMQPVLSINRMRKSISFYS